MWGFSWRTTRVPRLQGKGSQLRHGAGEEAQDTWEGTRVDVTRENRRASGIRNRSICVDIMHLMYNWTSWTCISTMTGLTTQVYFCDREKRKAWDLRLYAVGVGMKFNLNMDSKLSMDKRRITVLIQMWENNQVNCLAMHEFVKHNKSKEVEMKYAVGNKVWQAYSRRL